MSPRRLLIPLFRSRIALPWLAAVLALPLSAATPTELTIGTGPLDGVYYPVGGAICRLLNEEGEQHGLHCSVQSTTGALANLEALGKGEVQLALVQSDVLYHAVHGSGPFAGQPANETLRGLLRLHQESLTLVASAASNISTLADLEGKRVDLGNPDSSDRITTQALLNAMGWQVSDFAPAPTGNRLEGLCDGTLDAVFLMTGHPNQGIGDLLSRCKARLIPIEGEQITQLLKQHPYYQPSHIGASLYPGQIGGLNTFAVTAELVALASLPETEVRAVRDVLATRFKQFTRLYPALANLTPDTIRAGDIVPLHPGMLDAVPSALLPPPSPPAAEASAASATGDIAAPAQETAPASAASGTQPTP